MSAQLSFALDAVYKRDTGIRESAEHADGLEPGWGAGALRVLTEYACSSSGDFTSEDFRAFLATIDFPVPVPKALGAVFQKAARAGVIRRVGFGISRHRHLSPCPLWSRA